MAKLRKRMPHESGQGVPADFSWDKFNELIDVGSPEKIRIEAPAINMDKEEIVKLGVDTGAPMELSYSCYKGESDPCGVCESCMRRKRAFKKMGIEYD